MSLPGVPPARPPEAEVTAAVTRIPVPPQEAMAASSTPAPLQLQDVTETPTPAAIPALATMATGALPTTGLPPAEPAIMAMPPEVTAPITRATQPEVTAPTTTVEVMEGEGSMRQRSADRMATSTQRGSIVVGFGESRRTNTEHELPCATRLRRPVPTS
jgi:hypothetical protein